MYTLYTIEANRHTIAIFANKDAAKHALKTLEEGGSFNNYTIKAWSSLTTNIYADSVIVEEFNK